MGEGAGWSVFPAHRPLFPECVNLEIFTFCLLDGNIASEDSSLSDALVLEDGRFSHSLLLKVDSRLNRIILEAAWEWL